MPEVKAELIDELLNGYQKPEDIIGENGLLKQLTKAILERALNAEMSAHLGYKKYEAAASTAGTRETGRARRQWRESLGKLWWRRCGIGTRRSSRRS
jgi:putative transposase